ncbi:MAG: hypothetical protein EOO01_10950 [Chitinophagaceae bacterium]|nr:MAG: hypothetical protein EOO01_10950 [Chitinophagaceae bacterium]
MTRYFTAALILLLMSCSGNSTETKDKDKYQKSQESMEEVEQKNPQRFLSAKIDTKKNLLGQTVVKGTITSTAKIVSFKDVSITLRFFSKTGALLEEDQDTVFETVSPGSSVKFKTKYFAPKDSDSVSVTVTGAKL